MDIHGYLWISMDIHGFLGSSCTYYFIPLHAGLPAWKGEQHGDMAIPFHSICQWSTSLMWVFYG